MIIKNGKTIHLQGRDISYIMFENDDRDLLQFHFGKKLADCDYSLMTEEWDERYGFTSNAFALDSYPQEYPAYGLSDLRKPAYQVANKFKNTLSHLVVKEYIIHNDCVVQTEGMPSLLKNDKNADTLEVVMCDEIIGLEAHLFYTVFEEYNIIARHCVLVNKSGEEMEVLSAYSSSFDFAPGDYKMIHFAGTWGRENNMITTPLRLGIKAEAANARGGSGHQINPFVMIAEENASETYGDVYGFSLIYSGNHSTAAEVDQFGKLRVCQGINPYQFKWTLKDGESFCTPQSVMCFSENGYGDLSREYHDLYRTNLMRSRYTHAERPILINNWEGTYFDFTEEKLLDIAKRAKEAGIELFVLDDGWFGKRNDDCSSLGDWVVNMEKLPSGIDGLAKKVNDIGMKFGLWFEPEMVNPDSDLYRAHPDWAVKVKERVPLEVRQQLVLDLSRDEVCEYIIDAVSKILANANIEYVKWDMNRQITDMPYLGYNHRYTLGYYRIMSAITERFPHILFEGCSSGGGRFDPGVLAYMPQIWTSDNSDAVCRLKIQYGTSMCYPLYSISSHVTASPNHQCGRATTLKTRADVAYVGTFGYELDITKATDEEFEEIKAQVEYEKKLRGLVCEGDFYRLLSPFESNECAWQVVSKDKSKAFLFACRVLVAGRDPYAVIKLAGLAPDKKYRNSANNKVYSGDMLMYKGVKIDFKFEDFATETVLFEEV